MRRVLVITYYWPPAGGAGVQRWLKLTKYFPDLKLQTTVLTVDSSGATYPQVDEGLLSDVHPDLTVLRTPSFEPLNWYARLVGKKQVPYGGFSNVRKEGLVSVVSRFIRGNFFLPDARKGWNRYAWRAAKKVITEKDIDVVITTGTPHSTHLIGLKLKERTGVKWIADFRDPWSDIYYNDLLYRTAFARKWDERLERKVLSEADLVVANCQSNRALLQQKVAGLEVEVVENGFDEADFESKSVEPQSETFNIVFTGTMAASYEPDAFLNALKKLYSTGLKKVRWHIAGFVDERIIDQLKEWGMEEVVVLHGYISHEQVVDLLMKGHVLLNLFPKTRHDRGIPGKVFEYLAAGWPILNIGPEEGDAAQIIHICESGRSFEREQWDEVFQFLVDCYSAWETGHPTRAGNTKVKQYSRQQMAARYKILIERVIGQNVKSD